jgi:hypothetical protein
MHISMIAWGPHCYSFVTFVCIGICAHTFLVAGKIAHFLTMWAPGTNRVRSHLNGVMLCVIMLKVIMLNVIMLTVIKLTVIKLNVIMLNVIMLNVRNFAECHYAECHNAECA